LSVFVLEIEASDIYAVLGRVLDRARVTGLRLAAVAAKETDVGGYTISATVDTADCDIVDRLARQFAGMAGVTSVGVKRETTRRPSEAALVGLRSSAHCLPGNV
jgi:hypothetical protein